MVHLSPQGRTHPVTASWLEVADARGQLAALPPILGQHADVAAKPSASC
jgi:hypothetical protein